jgi:hypothetical protein
VAFHFKKASSVAIGTFNIYIIQPAWMVKVGILPPGTEVAIEANMTRPGFRISSPTLKSVWYVAPGKLALETVDESEDCGRLMSEVLRRLPVTPVFGIANNIVFEGNVEDAEGLPVFRSCKTAVSSPQAYVERERVFASSFGRDNRAFNLRLAIEGSIVALSGNAHTDLGQEGSAAEAAVTAESFVADKRELSLLFEKVFGAKLNVASHV